MSTAPPAHVGVNAIFLDPPMGGLDLYVRALVPELARRAPGTRFTVFANPEGADYLHQEGLGDAATIRTSSALRRGGRLVAELMAVGAWARREGCEILHSVAMTGPLRHAIPHVVTIADITWIVEPDRYERAQRLWRIAVPQVARRADRVIAISTAAADHIVEHLRVPRERVDVIAIGHGLANRPDPTPEPELRSRHDIPAGPMVLAVSAKKAHKNLRRLVAAVAHVPGAVLVMVGKPTPHEAELREEAARLGIADRVVFPPYVDDADLEGLYAAARVFVFPSLNEGFGIPILEAMARGVPVATSGVSSMPEVAGDAALLFDPRDELAIAAAIQRLMDDETLRADLIARGGARQASFTWAAAADGTLESYARAAYYGAGHVHRS
jgi:glycosyltransferase involved in cell wall biosynthesis